MADYTDTHLLCVLKQPYGKRFDQPKIIEYHPYNPPIRDTFGIWYRPNIVSSSKLSAKYYLSGKNYAYNTHL